MQCGGLPKGILPLLTLDDYGCPCPLLPVICAPACPQLPAELLESRWFQQEISLPHRMVLIWLVGLAARCKY